MTFLLDLSHFLIWINQSWWATYCGWKQNWDLLKNIFALPGFGKFMLLFKNEWMVTRFSLYHGLVRYTERYGSSINTGVCHTVNTAHEGHAKIHVFDLYFALLASCCCFQILKLWAADTSLFAVKCKFIVRKQRNRTLQPTHCKTTGL